MLFMLLLLESEKHRINRGLNSGVCLTSNYAQISSGRGNDAAQLSASLVKVMTKALEQANVELDQLCAIIPKIYQRYRNPTNIYLFNKCYDWKEE